jgi:hypothetical protein
LVKQALIEVHEGLFDTMIGQISPTP